MMVCIWYPDSSEIVAVKNFSLANIYKRNHQSGLMLSNGGGGKDNGQYRGNYFHYSCNASVTFGKQLTISLFNSIVTNIFFILASLKWIPGTSE